MQSVDTVSLERVAALVAEHGIHARPIRAVVAALTERPWTLAELVPALAVPRRTVEEVLAALGDDLERLPGERFRIGPRAAYRSGFGAEQLAATAPVDPLERAFAEAGDLLALVRDLRAAAPAAKRALDHVAATPETAVRRALWLDAHFDLAGGHLLCVGDHDLTALAACLLRPELTATVVDVDEQLLAYIDEVAERHGLAIRCLMGDLRFGLPQAAAGLAGLAFTDPPYTPDGIRLFLERAIEGLAGGGPVAGRILLAYGWSERTPALGLAVQRAILDLELVSEAVLPHFNRYEGAQAIGGASDLYLLRPTNKARRAPRKNAPTIYTHGEQSAEARASGLTPGVVDALLEAAGAPVLKVGPQAVPGLYAVDRPLGALWTGGVPGPARAGGIAVDATADPGSWLLRILLATDAERLVVAVRNDHPDLGDAVSQRSLAELVAPKWKLRFRRSTPGPTSALVEAIAADEPEELGVRLQRHVLDRAHGRLVNVWRDGLVAQLGLDKRAAAAAVAAYLPAGAFRVEGEATLMEIARHRLAPLLGAVRESAAVASEQG